ncbi:hypothetical protein [Aquabacterium sp. J223]|uniref:hypothetical protein n=1 Tax=Aquabacterium sp. J223 TaxID=2898431 RepID=UPI0021AD5E73|nr:hypothetical protein [Aquabacterium sp. J223]UUX94084.1 hypothetical protein LRS07_12080 [Aquabacterium sp. J223]
MALAFVVLWFATGGLLVVEHRSGDVDLRHLMYQAATASFSYTEFGAVRRGLAGTLIRATGLPQLPGLLAFHLGFGAVVSALAVSLVRRRGGPWREQLLFLLLLAALAAVWSTDIGRTDLAVAATLALAAMAMAAGRPLVAVGCVVVGLAFHETGFLYGVPLLAALAWQAGARRPPRRRLALGAALLGAVALGYLLIDRLPHADRLTMVQAIRARLPLDTALHTDMADWALYYALSGSRGVLTSICQNLHTDGNYGLHLVSGLAVIAAFVGLMAGRPGRAWAAPLLAGLPPYAFLAAAANDFARWTLLSCFVAWLVGVLRPGGGPAAAGRAVRLRLEGALLLALLIYPSERFQVPMRVFSPLPIAERLSMRLGGPITPMPWAFLPACDRHWRDVLTVPEPRPRETDLGSLIDPRR